MLCTWASLSWAWSLPSWYLKLKEVEGTKAVLAVLERCDVKSITFTVHSFTIHSAAGIYSSMLSRVHREFEAGCLRLVRSVATTVASRNCRRSRP